MRNREPSPNLFTGDIDERSVAERMGKIVERELFIPSGRLQDYQASVTRMSEFHDDDHSVTRKEIEDLIRGVMTGERLQRCFERSSQLITVRHRSRQTELIGAALCSVGPYFDLESIASSDSESLYTWYISAFGAHLDKGGHMNEYVLRQIARQAKESVRDVADTLHEIHGVFGSDVSSAGIYIDAAHTAVPTLMSDGIHFRVKQLMEALRAISVHPATQGSGFGDALAEVDSAVTLLKGEHGTHDFVKAFTESRPITQALSLQSISLGGDPATYRNMKRVAGATLSFFTSVLQALDTEFLRLTGKKLTKKPLMEASEDQQGGISVMADQQSGFPQASIYLTPSEASPEPVIRLGESYRQQEYVPPLIAELWNKVIVGKWWKSEVAGS